MAKERDKLSILLHEIGDKHGGHVYFQPPESLKIVYPAIVYKRSRIENTSADNLIYKQSGRYQITVIDKDPDSPLAWEVSRIPRISYVNQFVSDNLNHDVFMLNF